MMSVSDGPLEAHFAEWLVPFLLLGLREEDSYGDELAWKMSGFGFKERHSGVVYRALRRMEQEGVVVSEYDGSDRTISRRRYSITESGETCLERWVEALTRYREEMDLFFRTYSEGPTRGADR